MNFHLRNFQHHYLNLAQVCCLFQKAILLLILFLLLLILLLLLPYFQEILDSESNLFYRLHKLSTEFFHFLLLFLFFLHFSSVYLDHSTFLVNFQLFPLLNLKVLSHFLIFVEFLIFHFNLLLFTFLQQLVIHLFYHHFVLLIIFLISIFINNFLFLFLLVLLLLFLVLTLTHQY